MQYPKQNHADTDPDQNNCKRRNTFKRNFPYGIIYTVQEIRGTDKYMRFCLRLHRVKVENSGMGNKSEVTNG